MSNRFEKSIQAAVLAGALALAGCSGAGGGGDGTGTQGGSSTGGSDSGDDTGGGSGDGAQDDGELPYLTGAEVLDADEGTLLLTFSEPVQVGDNLADQFTLGSTRIQEEVFSLNVVFPGCSIITVITAADDFSSYSLVDSESVALTITDMEHSSDGTELILALSAPIDSANDPDGTGTLRLSYADPEDGTGITDLQGNAMESLTQTDLDQGVVQFIAGNSNVDAEAAPQLVTGYSIDGEYLVLSFSKQVDWGGGDPAAFVLRDSQYNPYQGTFTGPYSTISTCAESAYYFGDIIASVVAAEVTPLESRLVLELDSSIAEVEALDGRLWLEYTDPGDGTGVNDLDANALESFSLNSMRPGNIRKTNPELQSVF